MYDVEQASSRIKSNGCIARFIVARSIHQYEHWVFKYCCSFFKSDTMFVPVNIGF